MHTKLQTLLTTTKLLLNYHNMNYQEWHKSHAFETPKFAKSDSLSSEELGEARSLIALYNKRRRTATQIIKALQGRFSKLTTQSDAARVYWTETKKADTQAVHDLAKELGFTTYKVILSPSACKVCRKKTENGSKVFKSSEITKSGYGHAPPFHPNCYCILIPHVE